MNTTSMEWYHISLQFFSGIKPGFEGYPMPRYGHFMVSYYDTLVMYGGISLHTEYLKTLWVYQITKSKFGIYISYLTYIDAWIKIKSSNEMEGPGYLAYMSASVIE
jgi:hypothetical protein